MSSAWMGFRFKANEDRSIFGSRSRYWWFYLDEDPLTFMTDDIYNKFEQDYEMFGNTRYCNYRGTVSEIF